MVGVFLIQVFSGGFLHAFVCGSRGTEVIEKLPQTGLYYPNPLNASVKMTGFC